MFRLNLRSVCCACAAVVMAFVGVGANAASYYNVTSVSSTQLSNAVRLTIQSDGTLSPNISQSDYIDYGILNRQGWTSDAFKSVSCISFSLPNARSQVGSFVQVGKYPISHVEISVPASSDRSFQLDVKVWFYVPMKMRSIGGGGSYYGMQGDANGFDFASSGDRRSIIITVPIDRQPDITERRTSEGIPESDHQLAVLFENGFLNVHAKNTPVTDLMQAVTKATGRKVEADSTTERLVTAELPHISFESFIDRITESYGLVKSDTVDGIKLTGISPGTTGSFMNGIIKEVPVRYLKAEDARALLPNFLLDYIRIDHERNVLLVSGSQALIEKVEADLAKIDHPGRSVNVRVRLLEFASANDAMANLGITRSSTGSFISFDNLTGKIGYTVNSDIASDLEARLAALTASQSMRVVSDSNVTIESGQRGEVFSGLDKYVQVQQSGSNGMEERAIPVNVGTKLVVTPWTGGDNVTMSISSEIRNIGGIDAISGLPMVDTRSITGTFRVKNGDTILIGGLTESQNGGSVNRIPILGHLPLIGGLFRSHLSHRTTNEIVLLLTPQVVTDKRTS